MHAHSTQCVSFSVFYAPFVRTQTAVPRIPPELPAEACVLLRDCLNRSPPQRPTASDMLQEYVFVN